MSYEYHLAFWFWSALALAGVSVPFVVDGVRRLWSLIGTGPHGPDDSRGSRPATPTISYHSSPHPSSPGW